MKSLSLPVRRPASARSGRTLYGALVAIVHLALFALAACAQPSEQQEPTAKETGQSQDVAGADTLVIALGDSLYAGYGVRQNESFPADLEKALRQSGLSVRVHNAGVSGDTTAAGRQRLGFALDSLERTPDFAIVGLGGNDMLRGLSPDETRANLVAIIKELQSRGIGVMLTGMLAAPNLGPEYVENFNSIFPDLAREYNIGLYPFFLDGVLGDPNLMLPDGIHPNAIGIDAVVAKLAPVVAKEIEENNPSETGSETGGEN